MERIKIAMLDPIFGPGVPQVAVAPITVTPSGLSCQAELFLGPNDTTKVVTSGMVAFTSTGETQSVRLPVTMPTAGGVAYNVYLDVYADSYLLVAYQAIDDVIIPEAVVAPILWE